jgi:hypothetical protein
MKRILVILVLLGIVITGIFIRLYRFYDMPSGFIQDEAVLSYDLYSLMQTGYDHHGYKWPMTFQAFNDWVVHINYYQFIPFIALFGLDEYSLRYAMVFLSVISILLLYFIGKEVTNNNFVSLLMAFLFSLSNYSFMFCRWIGAPSVVIFYISLCLIYFIRGINNVSKRRILWIISGIIFALTMYTYPSIEAFLPMWFGAVSIYLLWQIQKNKRADMFIDLFLLSIICSLIVAPLIYDQLKNPEKLTIRMNMVSITSNNNQPVITYILNYFKYFSPFPLFLGGELNPTRTLPGFGYENYCIGFFYYLGLLLFILNRKYLLKKYPSLSNIKINIIFLFILIFPIFPSFTLPGGNFQRAPYIFPIIFLISAIGIDYALDMLKYIQSVSKYKTVYIGIAVIFIMYLFQQYNYYSNYFSLQFKGITQWYYQYGMKDVINYVSLNENKYQNIIIDNVINMPYIYILFYKKVDPKTLTSEDYQDFSKIDPNTNWLKVEKFRNYRFKKISPTEVDNSKLVKTFFNSPYSRYAAYDNGTNLIIRFEIIEQNNIY